MKKTNRGSFYKTPCMLWVAYRPV